MLQVRPFFIKKKKTFFIKKKQNIKFNGDIAKFFDTNVFSYVGSDFTVCKDAYYK